MLLIARLCLPFIVFWWPLPRKQHSSPINIKPRVSICDLWHDLSTSSSEREREKVCVCVCVWLRGEVGLSPGGGRGQDPGPARAGHTGRDPVGREVCDHPTPLISPLPNLYWIPSPLPASQYSLTSVIPSRPWESMSSPGSARTWFTIYPFQYTPDNKHTFTQQQGETIPVSVCDWDIYTDQRCLGSWAKVLWLFTTRHNA